MAYSSENSCKKGCSCDSCKGSHKSIKSEAFMDKVQGLVNAAKMGAADTIRQGFGTDDNLSMTTMPGLVPAAAGVVNTLNRLGAVDYAKTAANSAFNTAKNVAQTVAKVAPSVVGESLTNYLGSKEQLGDLKFERDEALKNARKAYTQGQHYEFQWHQQKAANLKKRIEQHPLYNKEGEDMKESNCNLKAPESMADYHYSDIKSSKEGGEYYSSEKGKTDSKVAPTGTSTKIKAGNTGEEYEDTGMKKQDKYAKLAEAAFGHINQNNPFRNTSLPVGKQMNEDLLNEVGDTPRGREALKNYSNKALKDMNRYAKYKIGRGGPAYDLSNFAVWGKGGWKDGKLYIQPTTYGKREQGIERAVDRLANQGYKPREESINQRFPDVERDIAAIMKESYKKKKMMEDATNIHIATPEQRDDWLNVGRGSMDIVDYINKYKV